MPALKPEDEQQIRVLCERIMSALHAHESASPGSIFSFVPLTELCDSQPQAKPEHIREAAIRLMSEGFIEIEDEPQTGESATRPRRAWYVHGVRMQNKDISSKRCGLTSRGRMAMPPLATSPIVQNVSSGVPTAPVVPWPSSLSPSKSDTPKKSKHYNFWLIVILVVVVVAVLGLGYWLLFQQNNNSSGATSPRSGDGNQRVVAATADTSCPISGRIRPDQEVVVCGQPPLTALFAAPYTSAQVRSTPSLNERFRVIGGPACPDGATWWQVRAASGLNGWMIEGEDATGVILCPAS